MDQITTHGDLAVSRLLQQYRGLPLLEAFVRALAGEVQALEDAAWDVYQLRQLALATGVQLDGLGEIVGELRQGRTDSEYRLYIGARMLINRCSGTVPELLAIFGPLVDGLTLTLVEYPPAAFVLRISGGAVPSPTDLIVMLREAKAGGVRAQLEYTTTDPSLQFTFDAGPGFDTGALAGILE